MRTEVVTADKLSPASQRMMLEFAQGDIRQRLDAIGQIREEANTAKAEAVRLTNEALRDVQNDKEVSMTEAIKRLGISRDTAYKALNKEAA